MMRVESHDHSKLICGGSDLFNSDSIIALYVPTAVLESRKAFDEAFSDLTWGPRLLGDTGKQDPHGPARDVGNGDRDSVQVRQLDEHSSQPRAEKLAADG